MNAKDFFINLNKRNVVFSSLFGLLFSLTFVLGYQLQNKGMTAPGLLGKLSVLGMAMLLNVVATPILYLFLTCMEKSKRRRPLLLSTKNSMLIFTLFWAVTFVLWIPAFLAYYPCVMSSDFDIQLYQIKQGHEYFTNHHPYLSTLEIEFFYKLAPLLGTVRKAMAALGLWHLLVMASAFAVLDLTIYKLTGKKWITIVSAIAFILYPVNPVLGLSTTKDVVFSASFLWFMCLMVNKFFVRKRSSMFEATDIGILFCGIVMCSFRNNAVYALSVSAGLLIIISRKQKKFWYAAMVLIILFVYRLSQNGIEKALGVESDTATPEMHNIIIQTLGRTYVNNKDTLSKEIKEKIEYYIPKDSLELYNPALSDPLKTPIAEETFDSHWKGNMRNVLKDWLSIGFAYPDDYLDAVLDLTRGYWYLGDTSYATVWGSGLELRMGLLHTNNSSGYYGMDEIWHESKLPGLELIYEKILSRNDFLKWPVLNVFFRLSFYILGMALIGVVFLYQRENKKLSYLLFPILYLGTLLLGPTAYIRYAFPIMVCVPIFVGLLFIDAENGG